eukprot:4933305-Prymnesium_polylepis.1
MPPGSTQNMTHAPPRCDMCTHTCAAQVAGRCAALGGSDRRGAFVHSRRANRAAVQGRPGRTRFDVPMGGSSSPRASRGAARCARRAGRVTRRAGRSSRAV